MDPRDEARKLYSEGKSLKDIAQELGINYNTVRQWKSRDKWDETGVTKKRNTKRCNTKQIPKPKEPDDLKDQQKFFAQLYVENFNATQAALKAGYSSKSAHVTGYQLLRNIKVREYITELKTYKRESILLEVDDVVERYMKIAFADMTDFVTFSCKEEPVIAGGEVKYDWDKDGEPVVMRHMVDTVNIKDSTQVDGGLINQISVGPSGIRIKLEDRMKALEWLSKYFEMFPMDRHKKNYDNARLDMEKQRFEHQKEMDERNNF